MNREELRATFALAMILALRMLGLFMILPVFALYAVTLQNATPLLIGIGLGIYGLTQAIFQVPFGMLSDHFGRKKIIIMGLAVFIAGSLLAAISHSIWGVILGRALQGGGAIGSTIMAAIADVTRPEQRTKAMAIAGMTIGFSFTFALILGPLFTTWISVSGIFWLTVLFGSIAILILLHYVPTTEQTMIETKIASCREIFLKMKYLFFSILMLHVILTATFVVLPIALQTLAGLVGNRQWLLYLPTLISAFILSIPCIIFAEKKHLVRDFFLAAILLLGISEIFLGFFAKHLLISAGSLVAFFTAFSVLEAFLPSLVSKSAPPASKGTALGIYSCSQFLGIFIGGLLGGGLQGRWGLSSVYLFCVLLVVFWVLIAFNTKKTQHLAKSIQI